MWKYIGIKECNEFLLFLNLFDCKDKNKYIKTIYSITNLVINEKAQVSSKYHKEIYYINKYGLYSHLKRKNINIKAEKYLKKLYGKILYLLQIDKGNLKFLEYKKVISNKIINKLGGFL